MNQPVQRIVESGLAGLGAGIVAGGLVGLGEGLSIAAGDPAVGGFAPLYGTLFYATLLAAGGAPFGAALGLLAHLLGKEQWDARWVWTASLVAMVTPVALVVLRFRIIRDLFHEKLAISSGAGIGVHVGLVLAGAVLAGGLWWLTSPREGGPLTAQSWPRLTALAYLPLVLIGLPALALGGDTETLPPKASDGSARQGPVILVMIDTLRADRLSPYGYNPKASPNLTAFAQDAVLFEQAFANASWTRPSVASLLTSLTPSGHKTMYKPDRLPDGVDTIAEAMSKGGWRTGGLVTNYNIAPYFNFAQGFDEYHYLQPDFYFFADEGASKLSLYNLARVIREKVAPATDNPNFYYRDAAITTDAVISWLGRHKEGNAFLFVTYMDPHDPYFARPLSGEFGVGVDGGRP